MSLGNQGVFQLLKMVAFRRILVFYNTKNRDHFGYIRAVSPRRQKQPCAVRSLRIPRGPD
jgi:hypothetical protein